MSGSDSQNASIMPSFPNIALHADYTGVVPIPPFLVFRTNYVVLTLCYEIFGMRAWSEHVFRCVKKSLIRTPILIPERTSNSKALVCRELPVAGRRWLYRPHHSTSIGGSMERLSTCIFERRLRAYSRTKQTVSVKAFACPFLASVPYSLNADPCRSGGYTVVVDVRIRCTGSTLFLHPLSVSQMFPKTTDNLMSSSTHLTPAL